MADTTSRNFVDRAIEAVSPTWAAKRYAARATLDTWRGTARASRRGAMQTRTSTPWSTSTSYKGGASADRIDYADMRSRGRRVRRENVIARSLAKAETDYVVSNGLTLRMRSKSQEFNRYGEKRFYRWLDSQADIMGMACASDLFRMSWEEPRVDGDGGFLLVKQNGRPRLQYIPGDLIVNPFGATAASFENLKDGVEIDGAGRPIAFHIKDADEYGKYTTTRMPARDFVYLAHRDGPLDVRGISAYSTIFGILDQLDSYTDAVTKAAILGAMFGLIHKVNRPGNMLTSLGTGTNSQGDEQKLITMENGMIRVEGTAESTYQVQANQPMQQTPDFIRAMFRLAALGFDMPLEIAARDVSQVNFSGGRIGLLGFYRTCRVKVDWLKSRCWNRIVSWWLSVERQRQELGFPDAFEIQFPADYLEFELHGREYDANDPMSESQARLLDVSIGLKSPQQIVDETGGDYEQNMLMLAEHRKVMQTAGIPVVLSTLTRDETVKTTAIDANGKPIAGVQPLNGAQITAAIDVMTKAREGALSDGAAIELLAQVGIPADRASAMVTSLQKLTVGSGDVAFKREVLKALLAVPAARESVYNATDIEDLISQTGLAGEKGYEAPWIPLVAPAGQLVSGATIYDTTGDVVGGDVVNDLQYDAPGRNGSSENPNDKQNDEEVPAETEGSESDTGGDDEDE